MYLENPFGRNESRRAPRVKYADAQKNAEKK